MTTRSRWLLLGGLVVALVVIGALNSFCLGTWWSTGLRLPRCPDGELRQVVSLRAEGVRRGGPGTVEVEAEARYTVGEAFETREAAIHDFTVTLALVDAAGAETALAPEEKGWQDAHPGRRAQVKLPAVPDGDYRLRARVTSRLGEGVVEAPLALYAPARVHVLTDRPLYEPGNSVRFRAVVLRARDLAPLDGRPGVWLVRDPSGEVVLEEKAPAGPWGVVAGSFPLDKGAPNGVWHVAWASAGATDELAFTVEPFTLPRFRVEAEPGKRYYRAGERPVIRGAATYSSGAPVAAAPVTITWSLRGGWPMPTEWQEEGVLPARAVTGPEGRFQLELPQIPADLDGQATLAARLAVVDSAGDRVEGAAELLLAKDGIQVAAVTELGGGLAEGSNNRVYLRVATPDGRPLSGARIRVRRAWEPRDPGLDALLDEDGVGSLQLDPGPAVNVVIPPAPYRPPPRPRPVVRGEVRELLTGEGAALDDQLALDGLLPALAPCARLVTGGAVTETLGLRVDEGGALAGVATGPGHLAACLSGRLAGKRLPPGPARLYQIPWTFSDPETPRLDVALEAAVPPPAELTVLLDTAARDARECVAAQAVEGPLPRALAFRARAGKKDLELAWVRDPRGVPGLPAATAACVEGRVRALTLAEPAPTDSIGFARLSVALAERVRAARPQATTLLGYELLVTAATDGEPSTKLRLEPGAVPSLRLRATPVLAEPGGAVTVELIRGPGFDGEVPTVVVVEHLHGRAEAKVDKAARAARVVLGADAEGWVTLRAGGSQARVYVRPRADLTVTVTPGRARYAPGQTAELALQTTSGGAGAPAAVGLLGVDESLGQLAPLPGPDDLARVRPKITMQEPAFGVLDGAALALGRIRGANAAAATILRVGSVPATAELDATVGASASTPFDPAVELTDRFYGVLAELHAQTRRWEAETPPAEKLRPPTMARLWAQALDTCAKRGERTDDAFGRRLRLHRLPPDLLALTAPRAVVGAGTRLPEDEESWTTWVAKEKP